MKTTALTRNESPMHSSMNIPSHKENPIFPLILVNRSHALKNAFETPNAGPEGSFAG